MYKIEKNKIKPFVQNGKQSLKPFCEALKDMKVGESIYLDRKPHAIMRSIMTSAQTFIGATFACRKDGNGYRIGRVK